PSAPPLSPLSLHDALPIWPWQHGFMKTSAARSHGTRRLGPALALVALLAFGAFGAAGELAVLHRVLAADRPSGQAEPTAPCDARSEEHTSELQSRENLVCR